jgi:circadian clock protein KaiB
VTNYRLEIVDCLADPRRALADGVLVTPTLLKLSPPPRQTLVGSLSDLSRVRSVLGLGQPTQPTPA